MESLLSENMQIIDVTQKFIFLWLNLRLLFYLSGKNFCFYFSSFISGYF